MNVLGRSSTVVECSLTGVSDMVGQDGQEIIDELDFNELEPTETGLMKILRGPTNC